MQQWKSQGKSNKSSMSSLARMMSQMDRKKIQENVIQKPDEDYYKKLSQPRSQNYLQLFREQTRISDEMEQIEQKLQALETEIGQAHEQETVKAEEAEVVKPEPATPKKKWWEEELPDMTEIVKAQEAKRLELQRQKEQMEEQYQAMKQQLAEYRKLLEQELPVTSGMLGFIYPSTKEQKLLQYGVIAAPGNSYDSPAELLEQVKPRSAQEEKQWIEGDKLYHSNYSDSLLDVEIYMYAVCVIYEDGTSKVFRD